MKIAVIGPGAIGGLVAGYLKLKGEDVSLIGKPEVVKAIRDNGLKIKGVRGEFNISIPAYETIVGFPDLVILATKTQDINQALRESLSLLHKSIIITTQNGVQAENIVVDCLGRNNIISSIVMFGATYLEPAVIVHNFEGKWIIGNFFGARPDEKMIAVSLVLDKIFPTVISENIKGMKYLKIFVNANNCISAILGSSMQEAFSDLEISRISIAIWKEGFEIISKLGIELVSLPGFPIENLTSLINMPTDKAAQVFSGIMTKLSKEPLYGSILQSIKRGRISEIDYINGEFAALAKNNNLSAPLNEKLVEMVHSVEKNNRFFSKEELIENTKGLFS